jgi:hypothetical protein
MLEYGEAILVRPVVEHFAEEEDRDAVRVTIMMPRRLRVKKVLPFREPKMSAFIFTPGWWKVE